MTFVAAAVGSAVVGGVLGGYGAYRGAQTQANAQNQATQAQLQMFQTINDQQAPWRQAGASALTDIANRADYFNTPVTSEQVMTQLAPNYDFIKEQGLGAIKNFDTQGGGLFSGNTLNDIAKWTTGYAQNSYQQAFQNFTGQQTNIFNRLGTIAGLGQTANATTAQAGATLGTGAAESTAAAGAARGAGYVGMANAGASAVNNAMSWYTLPYIMSMNNPGAGPG